MRCGEMSRSLSAVVPPVSALSSLRYADFWALSSTGRVPLSALVKYVMLPSAFVSVDNATSLVVLMWWTCQPSCFWKIST